MSFTVELRRPAQGSRQRGEASECDALTFGARSGRRSQKTFSKMSFEKYRNFTAVSDLSIEIAIRTFEEMK